MFLLCYMAIALNCDAPILSAVYNCFPSPTIDYLRQQDFKLVIICGAGGSGKTTLARFLRPDAEYCIFRTPYYYPRMFAEKAQHIICDGTRLNEHEHQTFFLRRLKEPVSRIILEVPTLAHLIPELLDQVDCIFCNNFQQGLTNFRELTQQYSVGQNNLAPHHWFVIPNPRKFYCLRESSLFIADTPWNANRN